MIRALTIFVLLALAATNATAFIFNSGNSGTANNALHAENLDNGTGTNVDLQGNFTGSFTGGTQEVTTNVAVGSHVYPSVMIVSGSVLADGTYVYAGDLYWDQVGNNTNHLLAQGIGLFLLHDTTNYLAHCVLDGNTFPAGRHLWNRIIYTNWTDLGGSIDITVTVPNTVVAGEFYASSFRDIYGPFPPSTNILTVTAATDYLTLTDIGAATNVLHPTGDPTQIILGDNSTLPLGLTTNIIGTNGVTYCFTNGILYAATGAAGGGFGGGGGLLTGLWGYWPYDDALSDVSGNGNDWSMTSGSAGYVTGALNDALFLDVGTVSATANSIGTVSALSQFCWIKNTVNSHLGSDFTTGQLYFQTGAAGQQGIFITIGANSYQVAGADNGAFNDGNFHLVGFTWSDGGYFRVYLDGVKIYEEADANGSSLTFAGLSAGPASDSTQMKDEHGVWTNALTDDQALALWNFGTPLPFSAFTN